MYLFKKISNHFVITILGWISKGLNIGMQLISIPIFYRKLGVDSFATFIVIIGLLPWYSLTELGLGSALQNLISEYRATNQDINELLKKISLLIGFIILGVAVFFLLTGKFLMDWLFKNLPNQLSVTIFIGIIICFCWAVIFQISYRIFFAKAQGGWAYLYQTMSSFLTFILILSVNYFSISINVNQALLIWVIPLLLLSLVSFVHSCGFKNIIFCQIDFLFFKSILRKAFPFWLFVLGGNGVLAIDYIIIVKILTPKDIIAYNLLYKIFGAMMVLYSTAISAIWPIIAEAYIYQSIQKIKTAEFLIKKTILGGILSVMLLTGLLIFFKKEIVLLFGLKQEITLPVTLLVIFGIYGIVRVWTDTYAMALQARNSMTIFLWTMPIQALVAIGFMIWFSQFGLQGLIAALILSFLLTVTFILPIAHYKRW